MKMKSASNLHEGCVVGIGEALWDLFPEGGKIGGAPANFAYHIAQLGLPGRIVSATGDDPQGRTLGAGLRRKGLRVSAKTVPFPTGTVGVTLDAAGKPEYDIREEVAWDHIPFTPTLEKLALGTRAVCFGTLAQRNSVSRETILRYLDTMPDEEGRYKIFDINLRQHYYTPEVIAASLERCNVLKINDDELKILRHTCGLGTAADGAACRELIRRYGLKIVILTCGSEGSWIYTPGNSSFLQPKKIEIGDTVGAGDSFTAAFTAALLRKREIREAHRLATEVAAFVCTQYGAMPELPGNLKALFR